MDRFLHLHLPASICKNPTNVLGFSWCLGLFAGVLIAYLASDSLSQMMPTAVESCASIVGLLFTVSLPFLLSAFAVSVAGAWLLIPIAFLKAFVFAFLGFGLITAYHCAGWLLRILFMFADCCTMPLLYNYWLKCCSGTSNSLWMSATAHLIPTLAIGILDFCVISPFLATLISY